jgi:hypothetical protein
MNICILVSLLFRKHVRKMRQAEWKALGLAGLENGGVIVTGTKDKKNDVIAKALRHAEQRRTTQACGIHGS